MGEQSCPCASGDERCKRISTGQGKVSLRLVQLLLCVPGFTSAQISGSQSGPPDKQQLSRGTGWKGNTHTHTPGVGEDPRVP